MTYDLMLLRESVFDALDHSIVNGYTIATDLKQEAIELLDYDASVETFAYSVNRLDLDAAIDFVVKCIGEWLVVHPDAPRATTDA